LGGILKDATIMEKQKVSICWLRRDLRLTDNTALYQALKSPYPVLLLFIFDKNILDQLDDKRDKRVAFIHETLFEINKEIVKYGSSVLMIHNKPAATFEHLVETYDIKEIFLNHDYEPYAIERDQQIKEFAKLHNISFHTYKDQVIFEKAEVLKSDQTPYTIFTPYANTWKQKYKEKEEIFYPSEKWLHNLIKTDPFAFPSLSEIGFEDIKSTISQPEINEELIRQYSDYRNIPSVEGTSKIGIHLRFGTVSVRQITRTASQLSEQWLNELIWREFFMMILCHFPQVVHHNFKRKYDAIKWRNNEHEFELWCQGKTGYPLVDAGMRQLNETGWMHNRVRMIVASFLCKLLLIDWRWGEAYFAQKLLDYELASNNGNWQWAAGSGCDSAPYFRIFNPSEQIRKYDPELKYIKRWIHDFRPGYIEPVVEYKLARSRALEVYKKALDQ
jgi:deoxyribodipyrimidine photo-lyase